MQLNNVTFHTALFNGRVINYMQGDKPVELLSDAVSNYSSDDVGEIIVFLNDIENKRQYDCSENDAVIDCDFGSEAVIVSMIPGQDYSIIMHNFLSGEGEQEKIENSDLKELLTKWLNFISNPPKDD